MESALLPQTHLPRVLRFPALPLLPSIAVNCGEAYRNAGGGFEGAICYG
jgi:hypothetical protein